ncbi:MAG: Hsp33 family molecular chaperone HslO [Betaproteobacteria bacterium]|nr:Hsp33 family molecular chaperone HslO [Betaproteobacteria bacterium]
MDDIANYCRRFTLENLDIRGQLVQLTSVWSGLHAGREYAPMVQGFLGELACVAVLVGSGLKQAGRVTVQIQRAGSGAPLAMADCTEALAVRGIVRNPEGAATFAEWAARGTLALTLTHQEPGKPPAMYQSIVPLSGLSIAECFEHYFDQSEQLPTHLWIASDAKGAGALLLQKLPGADTKDADGWARMEHLAASVTGAELTGASADELLHRLFHEEDVRLFRAKPVSYACRRDVAKVEAMLKSLGRDEVEATLAEQGEIVVTDDICNEQYRFGAEDVRRLFGA